jgi:hypothetical protein
MKQRRAGRSLSLPFGRRFAVNIAKLPELLTRRVLDQAYRNAIVGWQIRLECLLGKGKLVVSVMRPVITASFGGLIAACVMPADAAQRQPAPQPVVERSASGTIIQPTTTIVPDGTGHARIIVIPRRRSYLDTGTEVSIGDRKFNDYYSWPSGNPGRTNWFFGPDVQGTGHYPLPWGNGAPEYSGY